MLRLFLFVAVLTKAVDCETPCDGNDSCVIQDDRYSLADMSYVPQYRRFKKPANGSSNHQKSQASGGDHLSREKRSPFSARRKQTREGKPSLKSLFSDEDAAGDLNASLEMLQEFSRSMAYFDNVARMEEEHHHHHEHHSGNGTDEDEDEEGACTNVELSWDEHCYFLTKEPVAGFRAATVCAKTFATAEFSVIENEEINDLISDYVKKIDQTSGKPLHQQITYIYIKDDHQNPEFRDTKINPEEELFKKSICDMVGCQCTALRSLTGTWHSRICDTRHYALCRRPHRHEHGGELEEASTEATFVDKHDEEEISGGAPVTVVRFWFAMPAVIAILTQLLLLPVIDNGI